MGETRGKYPPVGPFSKEVANTTYNPIDIAPIAAVATTVNKQMFIEKLVKQYDPAELPLVLEAVKEMILRIAGGFDWSAKDRLKTSKDLTTALQNTITYMSDSEYMTFANTAQGEVNLAAGKRS